MCRYGGSYQEADDTALGPLEDWLRMPLGAGGFGVPPSPLFEDIQVATDGRVFFLTQNGSMGLGPASVRPGDSIHIFPSGRAHFVLRNHRAKWMEARQKSNQYEIIGDCYLNTNKATDERASAEQEPVIEGSLPYEGLGAKYLRERGLPIRETVKLI